MTEVLGQRARYLGVATWILVAVATGAMLFGVMPTSQGLEAALVSFLSILALRYVARWHGRSE